MITIFATLTMLAPLQINATPPAVPAELQGMHDFSACLARDHTKTAQLLSAVPGSDREYAVLVDLMKTGCPTIPEVTFDMTMLRGTVAEAAFEEDFDAVGAPARHRPVAIFTAPSAAELPAMPISVQYSIGLIDYATCVVEAGPQQAVALFRSRPGSTDEGAAFSGLSPLLGPCLPQGMEVKFTRPRLRGALAEAAYRVAATPK